MFDIRLHVNAIRQGHFQASNILSVFLDMVANFALFRKSAINPFVIKTLLHKNVVFPFILRIHTIIFWFYNLLKVNIYIKTAIC